MDTVANMLTAIVNAQRVKKERVAVPYSRLNEKLATLLADQKRVATFRVQEGEKAKLVITLKYGGEEEAGIRGARRISRPGARHYVSREKLPYPTHGDGFYVVSTNQGLMSEKAARKAGLGGELMGEVW
jgi:small subunit ribosomal protein S8